MADTEYHDDDIQGESSIADAKARLRRMVLARRRALANKDDDSRRIIARLTELPEYSAAHCVMFYVDARSEVRTRDAIQSALAAEKQIAVPYCDGDELIPWRLHAFDELTPGAFGILEPREDLRENRERRVNPESIDLVLIPGVAFDRMGNRLGSGRGYYDRLLPRLREDCLRVGLAFECQIVGQVPFDGHDVPMNVVITEVG